MCNCAVCTDEPTSAIGARQSSWQTDPLNLLNGVHHQHIWFAPIINLEEAMSHSLTSTSLPMTMLSAQELQYVNVLLTSFPGLGLPQTFNVVCRKTTTVCQLLENIKKRLPPLDCRLIVTTNCHKSLGTDRSPVSALLPDVSSTFVQLRLSVPLRGGKGGFGSQLRAAGGRMSSKKKRAQGENNGSNRNLDGRRLRTVNEAKALAEYLAMKPEMDKKQREERKRRWESVLDMTEQREEELRDGSKGKVDGTWVEDKEEAEDRTRDAVSMAIKAGLYYNPISTGTQDRDRQSLPDSKDNASDPTRHSSLNEPSTSQPSLRSGLARSYVGFDQDDEFVSSEDESHPSGPGLPCSNGGVE